MKLIIDIVYRDDKQERHICNDFPSTGEFLTLYKDDFKRESIRMETILSYKQHFMAKEEKYHKKETKKPKKGKKC